MNIEIDQSGKVEDTRLDTIVAFTNHFTKTIFIAARDKREIQRVFRSIGKPRIFMVKVFAMLIFLLVRVHLRELQIIVVDLEYPGQEHLIKDFLLREIRRVQPGFEAHNILFRSVGKKSKAHVAAAAVAHKKKLPDLIVTIKDILSLIM